MPNCPEHHACSWEEGEGGGVSVREEGVTGGGVSRAEAERSETARAQELARRQDGKFKCLQQTLGGACQADRSSAKGDGR